MQRWYTDELFFHCFRYNLALSCLSTPLFRAFSSVSTWRSSPAPIAYRQAFQGSSLFFQDSAVCWLIRTPSEHWAHQCTDAPRTPAFAAYSKLICKINASGLESLQWWSTSGMCPVFFLLRWRVDVPFDFQPSNVHRYLFISWYARAWSFCWQFKNPLLPMLANHFTQCKPFKPTACIQPHEFSPISFCVITRRLQGAS
jgi:hypothetical protein